ncbi:MAG TPA: cadmium resistance transporter, partial [Candidatus Caenarcaniphilales bacterium]
MNWLAVSIITAITAFVATNVDDLVILMLFFAQVNATFQPRHIVVGQYLGFTALIVACLPSLVGGLIVPRAWLGLLGLLPIGIGIRGLMNRSGNSEVHNVENLPHTLSSTTVCGKIASLLQPQTYTVAAVTVANGGDNVGIYVPLFASRELPQVGIILSIFFVLVGVWCFVGYQLAQHLAIAR